jgi:hypothetical protein
MASFTFPSSLLLENEVTKPQGPAILQNFPVGPVTHKVGNLWKVLRPVERAVLPKKGNENVPGDLRGKETEIFFSLFLKGRDDENADDKPLTRDTFCIEHHVAHLQEHLPDGFPAHFRVTGCLGIPYRTLFFCVPHVGKIDVHKAPQKPEDLGVLVTTGVIDNRDTETFLASTVNGFENLRNKVRWRDEIDVVASLPFQRPHHSGKAKGSDLNPFAKMADRVVLAVHTGHIASRKENSSRTPVPAEDFLFPKVGMKTRHPGKHPTTTESPLSLRAVNTTPPGAEGTGFQALGELLQNLPG